MAKVRRFSGNLKIELSFNDKSGKYKARLCPTVKGEACETVIVGPPRHLTHAVDSAAAYDSAARAAISFARADVAQYAQMGGGKFSSWHISRGRRRYVKGHPKRAK